MNWGVVLWLTVNVLAVSALCTFVTRGLRLPDWVAYSLGAVAGLVCGVTGTVPL